MKKRSLSFLLALALLITTGCTVFAASLGDLTGDGEINLKDVTKLFQYVNRQIDTLGGDGDITGDGEVNLKDVTKLFQFVNKQIDALSPADKTQETTDEPGPTGSPEATEEPKPTESPDPDPTAEPTPTPDPDDGEPKQPEIDDTESNSDMKMIVQIGSAAFTATLEDNAAVRELIEMMAEAPVSIDMRDYSGFEKVGSLGRSLTTDNHQTTTTAGDIVLYNGNQIVMFYGSNTWSYTKIGRIDDLTCWADALGIGSITAVFTLAEQKR